MVEVAVLTTVLEAVLARVAEAQVLEETQQAVLGQPTWAAAVVLVAMQVLLLVVGLVVAA